VAAALILATRPDDHTPEHMALNGRTERANHIYLEFLDGKLHSVNTLVSFRCGREDYWRNGYWNPVEGRPQVRFRQEDRRFNVRQNGTIPDVEPPVAVDYVLRGELAGDEPSANGTLSAQVVFGRGHDSMSCRGTVSFTASEPRQ
jgi:hypothetical protein